MNILGCVFIHLLFAILFSFYSNISFGQGAPTANAVARCGPGAVTIVAQMGNPAGTEMRLYDANIGGNLVSSATNGPNYSLVVNNVVTSSTFWLESFDAVNNTGSVRVPVAVTIHTVPGMPTNQDTLICEITPNLQQVINPYYTLILGGMGAPAGNQMNLYTQPQNDPVFSIAEFYPTPPTLAIPLPFNIPPNSHVFQLPANNVSTTYWVSSLDTVTGCESPRKQFSVNIIPAPPANPVSDQTRCGNGIVTFTYTLTGVPPFPLHLGFISVFPISALPPPIPLFVNNPITITTPTLTTNTDFIIGILNPETNCFNTVTFSAFVTPIPSLPIVQNICVNTGSAAVIPVTMGAIQGQRVELYASNAPPLQPIATDITPPYELTTPAIANNSTYYIAALNDPGNCRSSLAPVQVSVPPLPAANDVARCGPGNLTLTAATAAGFNLRWYDSPISPTPIFTGSPLELTNQVTTQTFYVSSFSNQGNGCEGERIPVVANIFENPPSPIVSNVSVCSGNSATFTVTPIGTVTEVRLYTQAVGGAPIATDNTQPFTLQTPPISMPTSFYVEAIIDIGGANCVSQNRTEAPVNIQTTVGAPVIATALACKDSTGTIIVNMGNPAGDGVYLYTSALGGVPIQTVTTAPYVIKTPLPVSATTTFWVEAFSNQPGCAASSRVQAVMNVLTPPSPPNSQTFSRCGAGAVTVTITNTTPGYCVMLYTSPTAGSYLTSDCLAQGYFDFFLSTSTTFYAGYNHSVVNCPSGRSSLQINVLPPIGQTPLAFDTARCGNGNVTIRAALGAASPAANNIGWYTQPSGGSMIHQGLTYTIPNLQKDTTLYVAAINTACQGPRIPVNAKIIRPPTAPSITGCMNAINTFTATVHTNGGHIVSLYSLPTGGAVLARDTVPDVLLKFQSATLASVTYYIEAYDTAVKCTTARTPVVANFNQNPQFPLAKVDSICGGGTYELTANFSPPPTIDLVVRLYSQALGGTPIQTDSAPPYQFTINGITTTSTYYLETFNPITQCNSSVRTTQIIKVNPLPAVPQSDTVSRCGPGVVTFSTNPPDPATQGVRLFTAPSGGAPIATDAQAPYFLVSDSIFANTSFYLETYNLITGCRSMQRSLALAKYILEPEHPAVQSLSSCEAGSFTFTAILGNPGGQVVTMFSTLGSLTPLSSDSSAAYELVSPLVTSTRTFYFEALDTLTGCRSARSEAQAIILPKPGLPSALDVARCGDGSVTFTVIMGSPAGNLMQLFDSPTANLPIASVSSPPFHLTTPPITITTSFYIRAVDTLTGCTSPFLTLRATKSSPPFPPSISAASRCGPGRLTFTIVPGSAEDVYIVIHSSPNSNSVVSQLLVAPFIFVSPLVDATTTFYAESISRFSGCKSVRNAFTAVINPLPLEPQAPEIWRCGKGELTFTFTMGTPAGDKIFLYESLFSTSPIDSASGPMYLIKTPSIITNTTYYAAAYNSATRCLGGRQMVSAKIEPIPAPPSISNVTQCGASVVCFTAYMNTPEGNEIRLYDSEQGSFIVTADDSSPYELCTQTLTTQTQYFAQVVNTQTGCASSRVSAIARIASRPGRPSALDVQRCGQGSVTITAQMGSPAGSKLVLFRSDTTQASIVEAINTPYLLTIPSVSTSSFFFVQAVEPSSGCVSDKVAVGVTIFPNPTPPGASNLSRCGPGAVTITVDMTVATANVVRLYTSSGAENAIVEIKNPPYEISLLNVSQSATYFLRTINESNNCSSPDVPVIIDINPVPAMPQAITNVICGAERATITAIMGIPGGTEIRLYDTQLRENIIASINRSPFTLETPILNNSTSYYMEVINSISGCASQLQTIPISVNPKPGIPMAFDGQRCGPGPVTFSANMSSPNGTALELFYDLEGGIAIDSDSTAPYILQSPILTTNTTYFVQSTDKQTGCKSNRFPVQAVIVALPGTPPPIALERCGPGPVTFTAEMGNPAGTVLRIYNQEEEGVLIAEAKDNPYVFTLFPTTSVTYYLESANTLFDCQSRRAPLTIKINPVPGVPTVEPLRRCGSGALTFSAFMGNPAGTQIRFFDLNSNLISMSALEPYVFTSPFVVNSTNFVFEVYDENTGCASPKLFQAFEILPVPGAPSVANIKNSCGASVFTFLASTGNPAGDEVRLYDGGGQLLSVASAPPYQLQTPVLNTTTTLFVASNFIMTGCQSQRSPIVFNVEQIPSPPLIPDQKNCSASSVSLPIRARMGEIPGTEIRIYTSPTATIPHLVNNTFPYDINIFSPLGKVTYYAEAYHSATECVSRRVPFIIDLLPLPADPVVGSSFRCGMGSVTFSARMLEPMGQLLRLYTTTSAQNPLQEINGFEGVFQSPFISATTTYFVRSENIQTGCLSNPVPVEVIVNEAPATPIPFNTGPYCMGDTVEIGVTPFPNIIYQWTGPNGFFSNAPNLKFVASSTTQIGAYQVVAISASCTSAIASTNIQINQAPPTPDPIFYREYTQAGYPCEGEEVNFAVRNIRSYEPGVKFYWIGPNNFESHPHFAPAISSVALTDSGQYSVYAVSNGCTSATAVFDLKVHPAPATPLASNTGPYCKNQDWIQLEATDLPGSITYIWKGPNGFNDFNQRPSPIRAEWNNAGIYSVSVATEYGCTSEVAVTNVIIQEVNFNLQLQSNSPICQGDALAFTVNGTNSAVYQWKTPQSEFTTSEINHQISNATFEDAGIYSVIAIVGSCTSAPATYRVLVMPRPQPPHVTIESPRCVGQTMRLNAEGSEADLVFFWKGPNAFFGVGHEHIRNSVNAQDAGFYSVVAILGSCTSEATLKEAIINEYPAPVTINSNAPVCLGTTLQLQVSPIQPNVTYIWKGPSGFSVWGPEAHLPIQQLSQAGGYSVTAILGGCSSIAYETRVQVLQPPRNPIAGSDAPKCLGQEVTMTASGVPGAVYIWSGPAGFTAIGPVVRRVMEQTFWGGNYSLAAIVAGCTSAFTSFPIQVIESPLSPEAFSNSPICAGATLELTALGGSSDLFFWTTPMGTHFQGGGPVFTRLNVRTTESGIYTVRAIARGCTSAAKELEVIINAPPQTPQAMNNGPLCQGQPYTLSAIGDAAEYWWQGPNGFYSSGKEVTHILNSSLDVGVYSVQAILNNCSSGVATTFVDMKSPPAPPLPSNDGTKCVGQTAVFRVNNAQPGLLYRWSGPNNFSAVGSMVSRTLQTVEEAGNYSVVAIDGPCTSAVGVTALVVDTLTYLPLPESNSPLCSGQTLNVSLAPQPGLSFRWSGPMGFIAATPSFSIPNITASNTGRYFLTASRGACSVTATLTIAVTERPATPRITSNSPVCQGQTLAFNAISTNATSYHWAGPNNFTSILPNPSITNVTTANAGVYSVTAIHNNCTSSVASVSVAVNLAPNNLTAGNPATLCEGEQLQLTANAISGASYIWRGPNNFFSSVQNPVRQNITTQDKGRYTVIAVVGNCSSTAETVDIDIVRRPSRPLLSYNGPLCEGQTLFLSASGSSAVNYLWSGPNDFIHQGALASIADIRKLQAGVYSVAAYIGQCTSDQATLNVEINHAPLDLAISTNAPLCVGEHLQLSAPFYEGATYSWNGPSGFYANGQNPIIYNPQTYQAGEYSLTVKIGNCESAMASVMVSIHPTPNSPMPSNNGPLCAGETLSLNVNFQPGVAYLWQGPNNFTSTLSQPILTNVQTQQGGAYNVVAIIGNCTSEVGRTMVDISPAPPANLSIQANSFNPCEGSLLELRVQFIEGATYRWSGPNGFSWLGGHTLVMNNIQPNQSGVYSVRVGIGNCFTQSSARVNVIAVPGQVSIGHNGPICEGQNLALTAPSFPGATYLWQGPAGFVSTMQNPTLPNASVNRTGNYSLTVRVGPCTAPMAVTRIAVGATPAAPIISSNQPVCSGEILKLTANTPPGAYQFLWRGPNNFMSDAPNPILNDVSWHASGTYSLTLVSGSCTSKTALSEVYIKPLPVVTAQSNGPICRGASLRLTATFIPDAIYLWNGPNNFSSGEYEVNIANATLLNNGIYNVAVIASGCTSRPASVAAHVMDGPSIEVSASSNSPVCETHSIYFNASFIPNAQYYWSGPGSFISTLQNPVLHNVSSLQAGIYSLVAIQGGCTSRVIEIPVEVGVAPKNIIADAVTPICQGENIQLAATNWPGAIYQWRGPAGWSSNQQNPVLVSPSTLQAGIYTVTAYVGNCISPPSFVEVSILPRPIIQAGSTGPACVNSSITLTATTVVGASYRWYGPGGFTSVQNNPVLWEAQPTQSGTYSVVAFIGNCSSTVATTQVQIWDVPSDFSAGSNTPICSGGQLNLTATSILGATYEWRGPGGYFSYEQNPSILNILPFQSGAYSVTARIGNCFSATREAFVQVVSWPENLTIGYTRPACVGSSLQLWAQEIPGATYQWIGPNGIGGSGREFTHSIVSQGDAGIYTLAVAMGNCSSYFYSDTVRIGKTPSVPAIEGVRDGSCAQERLELRVLNPESGVTYTWIGPEGYAQLGAVISLNQPKKGNYFVQAVAENGCASFSLPYSFDGNTAPSASFLGEDFALCQGQTGVVKLALEGARPLEVAYKLNGITKTITAFNDTLEWAVDESALFELISVTDSKGCAKRLAQRRSVTVYALPDVMLGEVSPVCHGATASVPVTVSNSGQSQNWILNYLENGLLKTFTGSGNGLFHLQTEPLQIAAQIQLLSITNLSAPIQCTRTLSGTNSFRALSVLNASSKALIASTSSQQICQGSSATIPLQLEGQGPWEVTYLENTLLKKVTLGSEGMQTMVTEILLTPERSVQFRLLEARDKNGCLGEARGETEVIVIPGPSVRFSQAQYSFCRGENIRLPLILEGTGQWSLTYEVNQVQQPTLNIGEALSPGPMQYLLSLPNNTGGIVNIKELKDGRGCKVTSNVQATVLLQDCGSGCPAPSNLGVENLTSQSATLRWEAVSNGAVCYIVSFGKAQTDPASWQQLLVPHPGTSYQLNGLEQGERYAFQVSANCSVCSARSGSRSEAKSGPEFQTQVSKISKRNDFALWNDLKVYPNPNPTQGPVRVEFDARLAGKANYKVVDLLGKVILQGVWSVGVGYNYYTLDFSKKSVGIYFIEIQLGNEKKLIKLIQQ